MSDIYKAKAHSSTNAYYERKSVLIKRACTHFLENHDINMRKLASESNEHLPNIYKYFINKDNLLAEVLITLFEDIKNRLAYSVDTYEHPFLALTQYGVNYINFSQHDHELFALLLDRNTSIPREGKDFNAVYEARLMLQSICKDIFSMNISIFPYEDGLADEEIDSYVERLSIIAWAGVHGLATILSNVHAFDLDVHTIQSHVRECIQYMHILKNSYLEDNPQVALEAISIIAQISTE